jgi:ATP-dependent Clp protease adaptor protein ClpS
MREQKMGNKEYTANNPELEQAFDKKSAEGRFLILHNDEVNTFDYVIDTLIKVCKMDSVQAEQCTYLVHYKGKCDIKKGTYDLLKPYKEALVDKGLEATID